MPKNKRSLRAKLLLEYRSVTIITLIMLVFWSLYAGSATEPQTGARYFMVMLQLTTLVGFLINRRWQRVGSAFMMLTGLAHTVILATAIQAQLLSSTPIIPIVAALVLTLPYLTAGFAFFSIAVRLDRTKRDDDNLRHDSDDHSVRLALADDAQPPAEVEAAPTQQGMQRRFASA